MVDPRHEHWAEVDRLIQEARILELKIKVDLLKTLDGALDTIEDSDDLMDFAKILEKVCQGVQLQCA